MTVSGERKCSKIHLHLGLCSGLLGEFKVLPQFTIIAITISCNNLWKSMFLSLQKTRKFGDFFLRLYGHLVKCLNFVVVSVSVDKLSC